MAETTRDEAALARWETEGGTCRPPVVVDRSPPMSAFARVYGAQHHLGTLGPAADADPDAPLIVRARD